MTSRHCAVGVIQASSSSLPTIELSSPLSTTPNMYILAQAIFFRTTCCLRALWQVLFFCVPGKTNFHGSQGMDIDPDTIRLVRGYSRTTTSVGTVAQRKREGQARRCRRSTSRSSRRSWSARLPWVAGTEAINQQNQQRFEVWLELWQLWVPRKVPRRVWTPDTRMGAARDKVARLEQAIAAMGNYQGPELDVLVAALKKAQKESQELHLEAQIRAREGFIERAKKRIEQFDLERAAEVQRMEESQKRLAELRALQVAHPGPLPPPVDANAEVSRLQQMVLDLQRQLQGPVAPLVVSPFRSRKREDYEPATEQEVLEWLADRQEDMNTALMAGNPSGAARISGMITDATRSLQPAVQPSMVTNMVR